MLSRHFWFCACLPFFVSFRCSSCELDYQKSNTNLNILKNVSELRDDFSLEITPFFKITVPLLPLSCVQVSCKFVCFNGKAEEIAHDIDETAETNNRKCETIAELRLYNYQFPSSTLSYGFLGPYSDKVEVIYIASSNITDIAPGTFANGSFREIYFENLKLTYLDKGFFDGITTSFQGFSIIQKDYPLQWITCNFLSPVKYQIRYLTVEAGLIEVNNLTGSDNLLNNLIFVDFRNNDFGVISDNTMFSKLSMVEHLDLSYSNIEVLPMFIFADFVTSLEYLDLSHNRLKTLTRTVFGWREIPRELKFYGHGNPWKCTCEFQKAMKSIILHQTQQMNCAEPDIYRNWSVFDDGICSEDALDTDNNNTEYISTKSMLVIETSTQKKQKHHSTTATHIETRSTHGYGSNALPVLTFTTATSDFGVESSEINSSSVKCVCHFGTNSNDLIYHRLKWPPMAFKILSHEQLTVLVITEPDPPSASIVKPRIHESIGLVWFSKVTTKYYKMEINYNEYGLGCYHSISYTTIVDDLMPNVAYTFCMVHRNKVTISPFSCKSIYVPANLNVQYNSVWLSSDMKGTGLSLVIFGIVMFSFAGILLIYLLLKSKPSLLKGSKRVTTLGGGHGSSEDIIVLPRARSMKSLKEREEQLAQRRSTISAYDTEKRRRSIESVASYESYINTNLYEVIPAYMKCQDVFKANTSPSTSITGTSLLSVKERIYHLGQNCNYFSPLNSTITAVDLVNYAEIPYRTKRISNDPLPEVPKDQEPYYGISLERREKPNVGVIYLLDSQV